MTEIAAAERDVTYRPRRLKPCGVALLLIAFGLAVALPLRADFSLPIDEAILPNPRSIVMALAAIFFLGLGILIIAGTLRGLPRLAVTPTGVRLKTIFGTTWADWESLAPFELATIHAGFRRSVAAATSGIVGAAASRNLLRKNKLTIPDSFHTPIDAIVADLNARHARAAGLSPALYPDAAAANAEKEKRFGVADFRLPWLTFAILAVLGAVFACEQIFAVTASGPLLRPSIATLEALGGLDQRSILSNGEWYRLFTAPLLHADILHLAANGIALLMVGFLLGRLVGRVWFLAFFVIGALGGSLMSLAVNPATLVSVGASGAIMGLFAAAFTSSFRLPAGTAARARVQAWSYRVLVPSLLPLATTTASGQIDYGAHFGGALSGALVAFCLLRSWPDTARLPRFHGVAVGISIIGMALLVASEAAAVRHYPRYQILAALIPSDQIPKTEVEVAAQAADLVARYPLDPRSHMLYGTVLYDSGDPAAAEREMRLAVTGAEELRFNFGLRFENTVRAMLAGILLQQGREAEAKEAARAFCQAQAANQLTEKLRTMITEAQLCE
jgi:rhomboid protease GluP